MGNLKKRFLMNYVEDGAYTRLPKEYQEVEYIESHGTEWIDTNIILAKNCAIDIDFQITNFISKTFFGARETATARIVLEAFATSGVDYGFNVNSTNQNILGSHSLVRKRVYWKIGETSWSVAGDITASKTYSGDLANLSTGIFIANGLIYQNGCPCKLFLCKLYDNNTLVRSFVPCYRKSDNEVGLYDVVSQTFFTNQGTGTFAKGDNVYYLPKEYQEVEYITFDGNSYIDTNYNATTQNLQTSLETSVDYSWNGTNYGSIFATDLNAGKRYDVDTHNNGGTNAYVMGYGNSGDIVSQTLNANTKYNVNYSYVLTGQYATIYLKHNNSTIKTVGTSTYFNTIRPTANILIGAMMQSSVTNFYGGNIYSCKIYGDGTLVRYFKPCYRKSDNEIGLYDCVNNVFYTNQGTGSFSKGENVYYGLPSEYQKVEYIQSGNGTNEYINTGIAYANNLAIKLKLMFLERTPSQQYDVNGWNDAPQIAKNSSGKWVNFGISTLTCNTGTIYQTTLTTSDKTLVVDGVGSYTSPNTPNNTKNFILFASSYTSGTQFGNYAYERIYDCRIASGATPQRVFVPCYRINGGEIGLYDIVNNTFYANSGTGSFSKGADDYDIIG